MTQLPAGRELDAQVGAAMGLKPRAACVGNPASAIAIWWPNYSDSETLITELINWLRSNCGIGCSVSLTSFQANLWQVTIEHEYPHRDVGTSAPTANLALCYAVLAVSKTEAGAC